MANDKIKTLIGYVTANVIMAIMEDNGVSETEAMEIFYNSKIFDRLCDTETGLYREGGSYVYDLYKIEKEHGYLKQLEI